MIIEDAQYLMSLHAMAEELQNIIVDYNRRASERGLTKEQMITLRREENELLTEVLKKQHRSLRWMAGEKIEPVTHYVEATLIAVGGLEY